jgi:CheY-like chemotaxis protein
MAHILVIDDEPSILSLFGQFFRDKGYSVAVAADGNEGMRLIKQQKPDLIITDIMMPEKDGLEVIQEVRRLSPELPVIAISGGMKGGLTSFLPHAKIFGAERVIEKPVPLTVLLAAVQELLGTSEGNK